MHSLNSSCKQIHAHVNFSVCAVSIKTP